MNDTVTDRLREALASLVASRLSETATRKIHRIVLEVDPIDPLDWLRTQTMSDRVYWQDRDNFCQIAGVGAADAVFARGADDLDNTFRTITDRLEGMHPEVRYFGGLRFDPSRPKKTHDPAWTDFPAARFVLPRFALIRERDRCRLACHVLGDPARAETDRIIAETRALCFAAPASHADTPHLMGRTDRPDRADWNRLIGGMLDQFARGSCVKTVLARRTALEFGDRVDPWTMLKRLRDQSSSCFVFGVQFDASAAFLGATPERLYRRDRRTIHTEAVAGTRPVSGEGAAGDPLAAELLASTKDRGEHELVVEGITSALDRVCERYSIVESRGLLRLRTLQHLITRIEGALGAGVDDCQLLSSLHPTPAVGGWPRASALDHLRRHEPFDRGWYSGPVGWIGSDAAEFAVGIRSALVHERFVDLFAGAGIVAGSDPDAEWIEIENKIIPFLVLLYGGRV